MVYMITATIVIDRKNGWKETGQVPTFFLDSAIQGITSAAHAERIAKSMLEITSDITAHVLASEWTDAIIVRTLEE
jgi:hypothetical protein